MTDDERRAEEARRRAEQDAEALAARREAVAQAQAEALAERKRKQALQLREVEREEVRALVAAIIHGDAAIEDIDPALLRSPQSQAALDIAEAIREIVERHILRAGTPGVLKDMASISGDEALDPRVRVAAARVFLSARIRLGGQRGDGGAAALRQMLERAGASPKDLAALSDAELEARARALLRNGAD